MTKHNAILQKSRRDYLAGFLQGGAEMIESREDLPIEIRQYASSVIEFLETQEILTQPHCAVCGGLLEEVRPGKYQCPACEEALTYG